MIKDLILFYSVRPQLGLVVPNCVYSNYDPTQYKIATVYGIFSRGLVHGTKAWASPSWSAHGQASLGPLRKKIWLVFSQLVNL